MANSKYEYVKNFELDDRLLPDCWLVVRIDGKQFKPFTESHGWTKPQDDRGTKLMNRCAEETMKQCGDIVLAIGASDEYSFVLRKDSSLFKRRASKITTYLVSLFTSQFVFLYNTYFGGESSAVCTDLRRPGEHTTSTTAPTTGPNTVPGETFIATGRATNEAIAGTEQADGAAPIGSVRADQFDHFYLANGRHRVMYRGQRGEQYAASHPVKSSAKKDNPCVRVDAETSPTLMYPPSFDGRIVCYPSDAVLRDYLSWRQVDYHINNLYNTCFWHLVLDGYSVTHAEARLKGTFSEDKNEILFNEYDTNYSRLPAVYRKGSVMVWSDHVGHSTGESDEDQDGEPKAKRAKTSGGVEGKSRRHVVVLHEDLIQDGFWSRNPGLVPYVSATQSARAALKIEKKRRKDEHKEARLQQAQANK